MSRWFLSALLLLQVIALACAADQKILGTDEVTAQATKPESAGETDIGPSEHHGWNPYQNGWELVSEAMSELRKIRPPTHRRSKKPTGLFTSLFQYALKALPSLRATAPPTAHEHTSPIITGPLLDGVKLLQQAADQNNTDAIYLLGQFNFYGNYSHPRNFKTAFDHYYRLASQYGNSSAQYMVGLMYATGIGDVVERDQAKALLYHTFAADQGHTRSEMTVAARHMNGIGVPKNCETACKYYKRVADKAMVWFRSGPPGGMTVTPEAYRLSDAVGGVYGEGASFVSSGINALKASPNSDAYASIDDVIEYLDLMSQKGDFKASFNLGRLYYEGQRGLERNVDLARRYFLGVTTKYWRAKDGRSIDGAKPQLEKIASKAAGYIGRMWLRGEGVAQDFKTAQKWFERGIKHGDSQSQWGLGLIYLHGYGVRKNVQKAFELFKAAADQDFSLAHVALGALHLDQGQPDDLKVANSYFEAAARWYNLEAQYYLAEMIHHGVGRDKTCGVAMQYYKNVAERSEPLVSSWTEANQAYEDGDVELAFLDYMMAAEQGYEKAQNNVAFLLDPTHSVFSLPVWLKRQASRPRLLQNSALALIYWTRSAIQSNIDSLVKMGDYYLSGIGTDVALDKAAQCYTGASEYFQSAQALYNLGWMHENGVGLTQDFHLAKRYYDQALETNEEAYLPVTISLVKLRIRSAWNTFTHGRINSIQDEPAPKKDWSLREWIQNFLQDEDVYYEDAYEEFYDDTITGSDGEPMGDELDADLDGIFESLLILSLVGTIMFLMWYRTQRQQAHRQAQENAARQQQQQAAAAAAAARMPPPPNRLPQQNQAPPFPPMADPNFAQWGAGGVGH
ncbi:putative ubiquitin-protein ligase sel1 [Rosellinia necatrix]|uniref:Putative ubiquitin-protein ligase sel1 n=1 Tax=Rosellinia necatrix TaxID=77044 RepID=A0A1W2TKG4_ROSNE|nr:putative ubiquitin-protein ligase sel1 [Rosellinia necatrix]